MVRAEPRVRRRAPRSNGAAERVAADGGYDLPIDVAPMEARSATALPEGAGWQYEPKWDGFRCIAFRAGEAVELRAKSGKPLGRYFPEVVSLLRGLAADRFVIDGELVIETQGRLSFDALQARLHPAESRIRRLATETPARFVLFDMLSLAGTDLMPLPLTTRRKALEKFGTKNANWDQLVLSPYTRDRGEAERWLGEFGRGDGWRRRKEIRPRLRKWPTGHGQGQAAANGGLCYRWIPIRNQ